MTPARAARIAGWGYLVIIAAGLFAEFFVRQRLYALEDSRRMFANLVAGEQLFRIGIAFDLVMLLADVVVAFALYQLFARVNQGLSLLAALFRLVQASVIGASLVNLTVLLPLLSSPETARRVQNLALAHGEGYRIGLAFFGVSCVVLSTLMRKSGFVPKPLAVLMAVAGLGYLVDTFGHIVAPHYPESLSQIVLLPAFVAELWFCAWLLIGGRHLSSPDEGDISETS